MPNRFHGQQREKILRRLVGEWLPGGPPVAILQGFPGCGKSQLASAVAESAIRGLDPIEVQSDWNDPVLDLFVELALALEAKEIPQLMQEFDKGTHANLGKALLEILRRKQILIVVDEFQRLLPKDTTTPPAPWAGIVEQLNNSPRPQGRLLIVSNRSIKTERWSENCQLEEVRGLPDQEAEALFSELLELRDLGATVPFERRRAIAHRLGGNPRALKTLVVGLRTESLDDLLSAAPDLLKPGDVVLDPRLVEDFEREILERALPKLEADLLKFMRWLSVHRRPFQKEALARFTGGRDTAEALRKQLFDRFLLERTVGGDIPHPLAREISVSRLRTDQGEWVQAHNLAANYHFRHFKARQLTGASTLTASYAELRHHLYEAGRISELHEASERLTQYALSQINLVTPVPANKESLEERIALLSAVPDDRRPKVLEYHLARSLMKRRAPGDSERALIHARKATGRGMPKDTWLIRLDLEYTLHGIYTALPVLSQALRHVSPDEGASELYTRGAEMKAKANRLDDAIKLLEEGIGAIPADKNLFSLYQSCAEMMAKANRLDDAIELLEKGIAVPGMTSLSPLYQSCAEMMAKANRLDDAIKLLEKGIAVPGMTSLAPLYQSCAEMMAKANRLDDAIKLLETGIEVPGMTSVESLYQSCAELMAKANRLDDAITLLEQGIAVISTDKNVSILYQAAMELAGKVGDYPRAETLAVKGLTAIPQGNNRYRIAETALRILSARSDAEARLRLLAFTGAQPLDPPQRALADYLLTRILGDWVQAAEVARKGHADFPNSVALWTNAVDARLALEQVTEADVLMKDYRVAGKQVRDHPIVWLKAYVSLIAGRLDEAKTLATLFAPNDLDSGRMLDEVEMLRLWSVARNGMNAPMEDSFPGVVEYRRRRFAQSPAGEKSQLAESPTQPCVLVVATEWDSRHGGLSTFNRDLCAALAGAGARVVCYVPQASSDEVERAKDVDVLLVEAPKLAGSQGAALLFQRPNLPSGFVPDIIIGHDRITGAASVTLARDDYPGSKKVLFIHTSPEEIEWHKEPREDSTSAERAAERKREQLGLAKECDLVVAVGPHLASEFGTDLHGAGIPVTLMELTPGLPEYPANEATTVPPSIRCLVLGRVEDYQLKGLDLAAKALGRVVANWKEGNAPKLVVRGAPVGTEAALRERLGKDSAPTELDIVVRHYVANETEIRNDLREASLVLMPSRKEGFGLIGLEAIACGVPTLISAQSGLAETVKLHAPHLASEWILPVTEDAVTKWVERIEFLLTGREGAFARAAALREQLSTTLDWESGAASLIDRLVPSRNS